MGHLSSPPQFMAAKLGLFKHKAVYVEESLRLRGRVLRK
jgi:hypothetical protein